jgi:ATP-dependent Lhr-like helicase
MLMPGSRAELEFGRSNWKDLYSVISGGGEFRAVTPDGEVVGTLDARFVTSEGAQDFSLGGSSWEVVKCDEDHGTVVVVPGEGQKSRVFWTGAPGILPAALQDSAKDCRNRNIHAPLAVRDREILGAGSRSIS